jgi:hypothetical protein
MPGLRCPLTGIVSPKKKEGAMGKRLGFIVIAVFLVIPTILRSQPASEHGGRPAGGGQAVLSISRLEMSPDPVREGQRVRFSLTLVNRSSITGRGNVSIKDRDEVVAEARGVLIRPGNNRIEFPESGYRFSRNEHCFSVDVDIMGTRRPVDFARDFCAQRTHGGWTLSEVAIGPFFVEDLDMSPDPARPRQEVRFRVRLRNGGTPVRASIRLEDRDETVARIENVLIASGIAEYEFPVTRYFLQRSDHCFKVSLELEGRVHKAESVRELCAKPYGWTLRP